MAVIGFYSSTGYIRDRSVLVRNPPVDFINMILFLSLFFLFDFHSCKNKYCVSHQEPHTKTIVNCTQIIGSHGSVTVV